MDDSAPSLDVAFDYSAASMVDARARNAFIQPAARPLSGRAGKVVALALRPKPFLQSGMKRCIDLIGALALALVFSPILLFVVVSLYCEGGNVLFGHTRIGKGGKAFKVYKFRTMVPKADELLPLLLAADPDLRTEWHRDHKLRQDPRVTYTGRFLRRTSLDELPQLINVIRGEMSLVGPRPIVRGEIKRYGRTVRDYLSVKPGLTGIWQVSGRNDTDYRRRIAMDRYYARNASLLLDAVVLLRTVRVVTNPRGAY